MPVVQYIPSQSMKVQGKKADVYKLYSKNWYIRELGGGNGNWLLTRPSDVLVNGTSYRAFVLNLYKTSRLTGALVGRFYNDLSTGKVSI